MRRINRHHRFFSRIDFNILLLILIIMSLLLIKTYWDNYKENIIENRFKNKDDFITSLKLRLGDKIRINYSKESAPYSFIANNDENGDEVMKIKEILGDFLENENLEKRIEDIIEWNPVSVDAKFSGDFNISVGAISKNPERCSEKYTCVENGYSDSPAILINKNASIKNISDLCLIKAINGNISIAALSNTSADNESGLKNLFSIEKCNNVNLKVNNIFQTRDEAVDSVIKGISIGYISDGKILKSLISKYDDEKRGKLSVLEFSRTENYVFLVKDPKHHFIIQLLEGDFLKKN